LAFEQIEIMVQTGPLAGDVELLLDGESAGTYALNRPAEGVATLTLLPKAGGDGTFKTFSLMTRSNKPVVVLQALVRPLASGVSVMSAGYPGATFSIFDRMDTTGFDQSLQSLHPDLLVLAFGTNEGFDDNLSANRYQQVVTRQLARFKKLLPDTQLVLIGPPLGARASQTQECGWQEPPKLAVVRQVQEQLAQSQSIPLWSWAQIMPQSCAGHQWTLDQPRLMADDHIHLTGEGYRRSAEAFVTFVTPLIDKQMRERADAVPKH
jgi:lysophospholipase L1-like esterase